jgi:hypothetical protein
VHQYNPWELAAHVAKSSDKPTTPEPVESEKPISPSLFSPNRNPKHVNRDNKAEKMAEDSSSKRKADDLHDEAAKGDEMEARVIESGEITEGLTDGVQEIIEDGRVTKIRRVEENDA